MKNICVIIRVYNRVQDLEICVDTIKKFWTRNNYHIIISFNGKKDGYSIPETVYLQSDKIIETESNLGHLKGNSQLILEALDSVPNKSDFLILLEADTWIFSDEIISKYIGIMSDSGAVWASSNWLEKYYSLAVDFALIDYKFAEENKEVFKFSRHPESAVCNYLIDNSFKFVYITELHPIHIPKLLRIFYNEYKGRFRTFLKAEMVTHHIEDLNGGIERKKFYLNVCTGKMIFNTGSEADIIKERRRISFYRFLGRIMPRSSWFKKKKKRGI